VISIRKATDALEQMEDLLHTVTRVYDNAVGSTAAYAIEVYPAEADGFREHLKALQQRIEGAANPEDWRTIESTFRGELRAYRDQAKTQLDRLCGEIKDAAQAVRIFAENVMAIDSDHDAHMKQALGHLQDLCHADSLDAVRSGIPTIANSITDSLRDMQRSHQTAVMELQEEIRLLHQQVERERHFRMIDPATGVWNREKLDACMEELLKNDQPFCTLLVYVRNLRHLESRHRRSMVDGALKALLERLSGLLDKNAIIGRWGENSFAGILRIPTAEGISIARLATEKLSGEYVVQENGVAHKIRLVSIAGVIDQAEGDDPGTFESKLLQMSDALAGA